MLQVEHHRRKSFAFFLEIRLECVEEISELLLINLEHHASDHRKHRTHKMGSVEIDRQGRKQVDILLVEIVSEHLLLRKNDLVADLVVANESQRLINILFPSPSRSAAVKSWCS